VLLVVPSAAFAQTLDRVIRISPRPEVLAWATKGLEPGTGRFLDELVCDRFGPRIARALLSGPTFAGEVARGLPTAVTLAVSDEAEARRLAERFHGPDFRVYISTDLVGVQVGGAVKNVLAIAAGIIDGLGFGANARAALVTRGLAEITRLGVALGGRPETFTGLAGLGDLLLTCTDDQSRNRRFGLALARGLSAAEAEASVGQVVEGVRNTRETTRLARRAGVEMPIAEQVERVLFQGVSPEAAVRTLLARRLKRETG
jgi:glycerol-3-phosphate dehydrogenase (NAD(P)+)